MRLLLLFTSLCDGSQGGLSNGGLHGIQNRRAIVLLSLVELVAQREEGFVHDLLHLGCGLVFSRFVGFPQLLLPCLLQLGHLVRVLPLQKDKLSDGHPRTTSARTCRDREFVLGFDVTGLVSLLVGILDLLLLGFLELGYILVVFFLEFFLSLPQLLRPLGLDLGFEQSGPLRHILQGIGFFLDKLLSRVVQLFVEVLLLCRMRVVQLCFLLAPLPCLLLQLLLQPFDGCGLLGQLFLEVGVLGLGLLSGDGFLLELLVQFSNLFFGRE